MRFGAHVPKKGIVDFPGPPVHHLDTRETSAKMMDSYFARAPRSEVSRIEEVILGEWDQDSSYQRLLRRRSVSALGEPGPSRPEVEKMVAVAATVPDHGRLQPYRFVVCDGGSRDDLADAFEKDALVANPELEAFAREKARKKATAAPIQVFLVYSPQGSSRIPEWEQHCTVACTGYALLLAADSLGYGASWKSLSYGIGPNIRELLGLRPQEEIFGWINMGTPKRVDLQPHGAHRDGLLTFL